KKIIGVNVLFTCLLCAYIIFGAYVFIYLESSYEQIFREQLISTKINCVNLLLEKYRTNNADKNLAHSIVNECVIDKLKSQKWTFLTTALYSFGIITTLGYGKIEPLTTSGKVFAVIYGFIGIPVTVILFTNFGRWIQTFLQYVEMKIHKKNEISSLSATTLILIVVIYLIIGGAIFSYLCGNFDFLSGIYWVFLCFTAIEYGQLIPKNHFYLPIALGYICIGLAISTIALDIGSAYVRKLHFIGQKLRDIANVKIWFGSKHLKVRELVNAVGQNIGIEPSLMHNIDLDSLISVAIKVKEGKLSKVPQSQCICDGIWPPELVPLFIKDGAFPIFVDSEKESPKLRMRYSVEGLPTSLGLNFVFRNRAALYEGKDKQRTDFSKVIPICPHNFHQNLEAVFSDRISPFSYHISE
ncbi:unnamed protein product, partial [Dracunculus medinensis]|uniref:Ion_trans_2 domain-containing protein n=1 Tax=Dracunculus medinensis TaxID=318479 RepID=A0A0N4UCZ8_DRAME